MSVLWNFLRLLRCCIAADDCRNQMVDFFSYLNHLEQVHRVFTVRNNSSGFTKRHAFHGNTFVRRKHGLKFYLMIPRQFNARHVSALPFKRKNGSTQQQFSVSRLPLLLLRSYRHMHLYTGTCQCYMP
jgi:hypothetical protein